MNCNENGRDAREGEFHAAAGCRSVLRRENVDRRAGNGRRWSLRRPASGLMRAFRWVIFWGGSARAFRRGGRGRRGAARRARVGRGGGKESDGAAWDWPG